MGSRRHKKEEGKYMKKKNILIMLSSVALAAIMTGSSVVAGPPAGTDTTSGVIRYAADGAAAATGTGDPSSKEESVYGILGADGTVQNLYAVNSFPDGGTVTDYGSYKDLINLTGVEKIIQEGDRITISGGPDAVRYQGTLTDLSLPWKIAITYTLDDQAILPANLAGKTGRLSVHLSVIQGDAAKEDFYNSYALQMTVALDNDLCSNVTSEGSSAVDAGGKKQLVYTILPGKGADITITADVHDFEMDPVTINGIRMNLDFSVDTSSYTAQIKDLSDALSELDSGAGDLLDGLDQLASGMTDYEAGVKTYKDGVDKLAGGAASLKGGADTLKSGVDQLAAGGASLNTGAAAIEKSTFDQINAQLAGMGLGLPVLTRENYAEVLMNLPDLASIKTQLDQTIAFTDGVQQYTQSVSQLSNGAGQISEGAGSLAEGVTSLSNGAQALYESADKLNDAVTKVRDGMKDYKDGTAQLSDETSDMDTKIDEQIDEILGSILGQEMAPGSFVSAKNTDVLAVQFLMKTEAIRVPEVKETAAVAAEPSFWDRITALFEF